MADPRSQVNHWSGAEKAAIVACISFCVVTKDLCPYLMKISVKIEIYIDLVLVFF